MVTNTYSPHVGGVAHSVEGFANEHRRNGHQVLVIAPTFEGNGADNDHEVVRLPAIQHFNGSDFSIPVPLPGKLRRAVRSFSPDVVHSHHPFLLGDTALRIAARRRLPVVFTHHTLYEKYAHHVTSDSVRLQNFIIELAVGYCNLCDAVIAPSETVADMLTERGVETPIAVIPTGVTESAFSKGDGTAFRRSSSVPEEAFLLGHVGRLAPEKNIDFLVRGVGRYLIENPDSYFLLAGEGTASASARALLQELGVDERVRYFGVLGPDDLAAAYKAMDVFAFASHSETQGMVLSEAMAAGTPVVAVDASGVREIVRDRVNGRLLYEDDEQEFVAALEWLKNLTSESRSKLGRAVAATAAKYSMPETAKQAALLYQEVIDQGTTDPELGEGRWAATRQRLTEEWKIAKNLLNAASEGLSEVADPNLR